MGSRLALLRSGVSAITVGNISVAVSVAAMLAAGPRLLGHEAFVGLALAWTVTTVFGYGLAVPTEQLITRRTSARDPRGTAHPMRNLAVLCLISCTALAVVGGGAGAMSVFPPAVPSAMVGVAGWTMLAMMRGRVAGAGELHAYGLMLGLEAFARIMLVGAAMLEKAWAPWLLAASVGAPILLAALSALIGPHRTHEQARTAPIRGRESEQLTFVLVAVGYQLCLNSAPLVMAWRLDPSLQVGVGAFVIASSYYRLAAVFGGGFATQTLVSLSRVWSDGERLAFRKRLTRGVLGAAAVSASATVGAAVLGPVALPLLNGRDPELSVLVVLALGASTVAATAASVATTGLMAARRGATAAAWWIGGATVQLVLMTLSDTIGGVTAMALLMGPTLVLGGVVFTAARAAPMKLARP